MTKGLRPQTIANGLALKTWKTMAREPAGTILTAQLSRATPAAAFVNPRNRTETRMGSRK
jgi:alkaline phosphatase